MRRDEAVRPGAAADECGVLDRLEDDVTQGRRRKQAERYALVVVPEIRLEPARPADAAPIAQLSRLLIERGLAWRWTPQAVAARISDSETAAAPAAPRSNVSTDPIYPKRK